MTVNKLHLVSTHEKGMNYRDGIVIALTPSACYELDDEKIEYYIPEDFYDWKSFYWNSDEFFDEQVEWIKSFDQILYDSVTILQSSNASPFYSLGIMIKMIVDHLIFMCHLLNRIDKKYSFDEIIYYDESINYYLDMKKYSYSEDVLYVQLIELICKIDHKNFSIQKVHNTNTINIKVRHNRKIYTLIKYCRKITTTFTAMINNFRIRDHSSPGILFLSTSYGLDHLLKLSSKKFKLFIMHNGNIYSLTNPFRKLKSEDPGYYMTSELDTIDWDNISEMMFSKYHVQSWLNKKTNYDLTRIIKPAFKYFLAEICAQFVELHYRYIEMFKNDNINFVITPYQESMYEVAAMSSAYCLESCRGIEFEHGYQPFERKKYWQLDQTPCDVHIQIINENHNIMGDEFIESNNIKSMTSPLFFSTVRGKKYNVKRINYLENQKKRVVFVPGGFGGKNILIGGGEYPDCWYYRHQIKMLKIFTSFDDFIFIYKAFPSKNIKSNPIVRQVINKQFCNICFSNDNLLNEYKKANFVVMDYASTPMIESIFMEIPTLAFYPEGLRIRKSAQEKFGKTLQAFKNYDDIFLHLKLFFNSKPKEYIEPLVDRDSQNLIDELFALVKKDKICR